MKKYLINKEAMNRLNSSHFPKSVKDVFGALMGMASKTNADKATIRLTWHEDDIDDDVFIPFMTVGVMKLSEFKKEDKKKNTKRHFSFNIPGKDVPEKVRPFIKNYNKGFGVGKHC